MFINSGQQKYSKSYPVKPKCSDINKPTNNLEYEFDSGAINKERRLQDFLNKTTKKGIFNEVRVLIEEAQKKQDDELNMKRQRLKNLLVVEDNAYENEANERLQDILQNDTERRHEAFLQMKIHQEQERQRFVEQKKLQQHLNNCQELRSHLRKQILEESKICQLKQIEDRGKQMTSEKDENNMWHEILSQMNKEQLFKEYTEKERCRLRNACMVKALDEQVAGKGDAKYRKRIEEIEERRLNAIKCTEIDELEKKKASEKLEKQKTLALDLQKQCERKSLLMEEYMARELHEGRMLAEQIEREQAKQRKSRMFNTEKSREEIFEFLHYLDKMRDDEKLTIAEEEAIIKAYQEKVAAEAIAEKEKLNRQKRILEEETYKGQLHQINELQKGKISELNEKLEEARKVNAECQQFTELERKAADKRHEESIEMRQILQEQIDQQKALKAKIKEESNADLERSIELDEAYNQLTNTILNAETNILPLHPNYEKLITYYNRFSAR